MTEQRDMTVTDPEWETELRAGMAEDGDVGSVEPELAVARLLLHARAPAELTMARQEMIWREIDGAIAPLHAGPWWKRIKLVWAAPAVAAAAAVVLVVVLQPESPSDTAPPKLAATDAKSIAVQLENQFAVLAPGARADVARRVDASRGNMRGDLLAMAQGSGTQGGAP